VATEEGEAYRTIIVVLTEEATRPLSPYSREKKA
jgi:hypothetical protein